MFSIILVFKLYFVIRNLWALFKVILIYIEQKEYPKREKTKTARSSIS